MNNKNWSDVPEMVALNFTSRCNLNCNYCFEKVNRNQAQDATFSETLSVLNQLDSLGVPDVLLEGGEVFASPFITELLSRLNDYKIKFHLITNGTLLTPKLADMISQLDLTVGVSLDGHIPELNSHRGDEITFYKAVSAIKLLISKGITTHVNCTVTRNNADSIEQFIEFCNKLKVHGIVLQEIHCSGRADNQFFLNNHISNGQASLIKDIYEEGKRKYPTMDFETSELFFWSDAPGRFLRACNPNLEYKPKKLFRCSAGRSSCVITSNLDVIPCGILENFSCGNLREKSFKEIWHRSERLYLIRRMSEFRADKIPGCEECIYNPICDGGCRGDMFNYANDWLAPNIMCPHRNSKEIVTTRIS